MDKNPAKFFDKILSVLSTDYNKSFSIEEIISKVYEKELKQNGKKGIEGFFNDIHYETNVINALMFLKSQGLVAFDEIEKISFINTSGFVKIKTEGFQNEIRNKNINLWLQRLTWFVAILTFILTLFIQCPKNIEPTNASNCNYDTLSHTKYQKVLKK